MTKTILITGATDGIGLAAALQLAEAGHHLLLHGRNPDKLATVQARVGQEAQTFRADLSRLNEVEALAAAVRAAQPRLDVLINNAGVLKAAQTVTEAGLDLRFVVNALAPCLLTRRLLPVLPRDGRVVNLSSAAQAPVDLAALRGAAAPLRDMDAYAQSKLALTAWSAALAAELPEGPLVVAVNPGSLLATNMVREGFGIAGNDLAIGADILCRAALSDAFEGMSGRYYDNDAGRFGAPHPDVQDPVTSARVVKEMASVLAAQGHPL